MQIASPYRLYTKAGSHRETKQLISIYSQLYKKVLCLLLLSPSYSFCSRLIFSLYPLSKPSPPPNLSSSLFIIRAYLCFDLLSSIFTVDIPDVERTLIFSFHLLSYSSLPLTPKLFFCFVLS